MKFFIMTFLAVSSFSLFAHEYSDIPREQYVNLERYMGTWYAQYDIPARFSRRCIGQSAFYQLQDNGKVFLRNTCYKKRGKKSDITGTARVVNKETNSELSIKFNNFFTRLFGVEGQYNIVKLDPNYEMVLIGSVDRKQMWIMSRQVEVDPYLLQDFVDYAAGLGFDTQKFRRGNFNQL